MLDSTTNDNWTWAATNVTIWNIVISVNLAIPVAAFKEALKHPGEYQDDGSWI